MTDPRIAVLERLKAPGVRDLVVVGGGATGLGVALDAAVRGFSVALVESHDFGGGTSSRSTKLVHGGVRYLAQGNLSLVREALHERTTLLANASHLAQPLAFVMPSYRVWETPFYGAGLALYDALAGKAGLGRTRFLGRRETLARMPGLRPDGLRGGVQYWDGQFDDARLAIALARTAEARGAVVANHVEAEGLLHDPAGRLAGVRCVDRESGAAFELHARCVVNATGVWVDILRRRDGEAAGRGAAAGSTANMVAPSQGVHVVVEQDFLPGDRALMVPKTADGRVLFGVPWLGKLVLGTTDTPRPDVVREPRPFREELDFILGEAGRYLARSPTRADVKSCWVGLRPLVKPASEDPEGVGATKGLSREHVVRIGRSGLVTVTGGKWTTYRAMAEDVLAQAFDAGLLPSRTGGVTVKLPLVGAESRTRPSVSLSAPPGPHLYGVEAAALAALPGANRALGGGLTEAMVRFAARREHARTVEDVLARRSRLLFLDARLAASIAGSVAAILAEETSADPAPEAFEALAALYLDVSDGPTGPAS